MSILYYFYFNISYFLLLSLQRIKISQSQSSIEGGFVDLIIIFEVSQNNKTDTLSRKGTDTGQYYMPCENLRQVRISLITRVAFRKHITTANYF